MMNTIIVLLVVVVGVVNTELDSLQHQLLHPCLPSKSRDENSLQNGSHPAATTPAQRQYRLHDIQSNMMEAARSVSKMQKNIKRELRKKNKRFKATFMQYEKDMKRITKTFKKSSIFKSLKTKQRSKVCLTQNLKLHYTTVSHIYSHLSQVPRRHGRTKQARRWNKTLSQLQKKHLLILCRLKTSLLSERTTLPSIPTVQATVFSGDIIRGRLDLYKQLTHFKLYFKRMIRLYKYYNARRNIRTKCKG